MAIYEMKSSKEFERPLVPDGMYEAVLTQIQDIEDGKWGKRIRLIYESVIGDKKVEFARTGYAKFSKKSKLGTDFTSMGVIEGAKFDPKDFIGKKVKIYVKQIEIDREGKLVKQSVVQDVLKL